MHLQTLKTVSRRTATVVGAVVITTVVVSGTLSVAQAASQAVAENVPNNSVTSGKIVDGTIRSVDVKDGTLTGVDVTDNSLGGADIFNGSVTTNDIADGSLTSADLASAIRPRYAKVETGTTFSIIRQRGATAVNRTGNGEYDVTFDIAITGCGWIATRNDDASGGGGPGEIAVEQASSSDPNRLRIRLFNSAGSQTDPEADDGFTVTVIC
jgi:hypothetical protein